MRTNLRSIIPVSCLTFGLSSFVMGCADGSSSGSSGSSARASQNSSNDPCADHFITSDIQNRVQRMEVCTLVNKVRAENGLLPLKLEPGHNHLAQGHAVDMSENNFESHAGSDGSSPDERLRRVGIEFAAWGENIAVESTNPTSVMEGWENSAESMANILNPDFKYLGVGYENTRWVQVFTD